MTSRLRLFVLAVVFATCLGFDQATKGLAALVLRGAPAFSFCGDALRLQYVVNAGAFLGLGSALPAWERQALLTGAAGGVLLALAAFLVVRRELKVQDFLGYALILSGGASNLLDRAVRGEVVDFLNVGLGPVRSGIFNLADLAITTGLALVLAAHLLRRSREGRDIR